MSLYQGAAGLNANARWQEVISENLASASIPGFKKQDLSFAAVQAGLLSPGAKGQSQAVSMSGVRPHTNFSPGEIKRTDVSTDFAIEGDAFFEVQLPNGSSAYTRDGEFKVNAQGQLVTKQGYPVMGENGPIQLDSNHSVAVTVASDGTISQGTEVRGKLALTSFNDRQLLTSVGGGFYTASNLNLQKLPESNSTIRQGFLEGSNTSSVAEMSNLITAMRAYEANQRLVQTEDERMGKAISELGSPN